MSRAPAGTRKQQILETLVMDLESAPGQRITTARLARNVGVSEAALYRHFSSKSDMFEALIAFAEESVFGLCNRIAQEQLPLNQRTERMALVVLGFGERNPGICRVLLGDALIGESPMLRARVRQFFERFETQVRAMMRESDLTSSERTSAVATRVAALLTTLVEGRLSRFVRSDFGHLPTVDFDADWKLLRAALFRD
jgi:TetR/AcrR family transcriptional regulator